VNGLPIEETFTVEADDDGQATNTRFVPNVITAEAGHVIEITVPNIGSVAHNLRVAGLDGEYEPDAPRSDDWITDPATIEAGQEGKVVVKIDEPGSYPFRCDFHALQQIGTLILR
jgi:plastocyanin